ncbi:MAG: hypothetical protein D3909_08945 [Candidatus Electrothrix sp. ATG1]|nr:hypothetical protein [Candidatus Electrothrix sp. ATG1]
MLLRMLRMLHKHIFIWPYIRPLSGFVNSSQSSNKLIRKPSLKWNHVKRCRFNTFFKGTEISLAPQKNRWLWKVTTKSDS